MFDVRKTLISQYATSPTISALVGFMGAYVDPSANIDDFYSKVFDIQTAQGFGLDVWGRIVGVKRDLTISESNYFGFSEATSGGYVNGLSLDFKTGQYNYTYSNYDPNISGAHAFSESPFYDPTVSPTNTYSLADDAYRKLILLKALANICETTIPAINALLNSYFANRGRCYVSDMGGMALRYTFEFLLTPVEFSIVTQSGTIPRPAGVSATLINLQLPTFGFSEAGASAAPFGVGTFVSPSANAAI